MAHDERGSPGTAKSLRCASGTLNFERADGIPYTRPVRSLNNKRESLKMKGVILGLVGFAVLIVVLAANQRGNDPEFKEEQACKERIKLLSKNPVTVNIGTPGHSSLGDGKDLLTWSASELQMQNGFGAMMGTRAVCHVDRDTAKVTFVDFN